MCAFGGERGMDLSGGEFCTQGDNMSGDASKRLCYRKRKKSSICTEKHALSALSVTSEVLSSESPRVSFLF